ncbi:MAG: MCE family protein [Burkholderiales bacterium]|nr:MCE family protein [Burkholderiales bacterium]
MEPEARYTLIGTALLILLAALISVLIWLARGGSQDQWRNYSIYFEKQSLDGLQIGGDVTMRGVKVGRVERYEIMRNNINRVHVLDSVDANTPVSTNTSAIVTRNILTGIARIDLMTPEKPGPELTRSIADEPYPVIAEGKSEFDEITGTVSRVTQIAESFLGKADNLLAQENQAKLVALIDSLRRLSQHLDQRVERIDQVALAVTAAAAQFELASRNTAEAASKISASVPALSTQTQTTLQEFSDMARVLREQTERLSGRLDNTADSAQRQLAVTARELRASAELIARAADRLQEPRAALLGPGDSQLGPGEKLK